MNGDSSRAVALLGAILAFSLAGRGEIAQAAATPLAQPFKLNVLTEVNKGLAFVEALANVHDPFDVPSISRALGKPVTCSTATGSFTMAPQILDIISHIPCSAVPGAASDPPEVITFNVRAQSLQTGDWFIRGSTIVTQLQTERLGVEWILSEIFWAHACPSSAEIRTVLGSRTQPSSQKATPQTNEGLARGNVFILKAANSTIASLETRQVNGNNSATCVVDFKLRRYLTPAPTSVPPVGRTSSLQCPSAACGVPNDSDPPKGPYRLLASSEDPICEKVLKALDLQGKDQNNDPSVRIIGPVTNSSGIVENGVGIAAFLTWHRLNVNMADESAVENARDKVLVRFSQLPIWTIVDYANSGEARLVFQARWTISNDLSISTLPKVPVPLSQKDWSNPDSYVGLRAVLVPTPSRCGGGEGDPLYAAGFLRSERALDGHLCKKGESIDFLAPAGRIEIPDADLEVLRGIDFVRSRGTVYVLYDYAAGPRVAVARRNPKLNTPSLVHDVAFFRIVLFQGARFHDKCAIEKGEIAAPLTISISR